MHGHSDNKQLVKVLSFKGCCSQLFHPLCINNLCDRVHVHYDHAIDFLICQLMCVTTINFSIGANPKVTFLHQWLIGDKSAIIMPLLFYNYHCVSGLLSICIVIASYIPLITLFGWSELMSAMKIRMDCDLIQFCERELYVWTGKIANNAWTQSATCFHFWVSVRDNNCLLTIMDIIPFIRIRCNHHEWLNHTSTFLIYYTPLG